MTFQYFYQAKLILIAIILCVCSPALGVLPLPQQAGVGKSRLLRRCYPYCVCHPTICSVVTRLLLPAVSQSIAKKDGKKQKTKERKTTISAPNGFDTKKALSTETPLPLASASISSVRGYLPGTTFALNYSTSCHVRFCCCWTLRYKHLPVPIHGNNTYLAYHWCRCEHAFYGISCYE